MHFYGGSLSYETLLNMPWGQVLMFYEYMAYIQRWGTEKGKKHNEMLDRTDVLKYGWNDTNEDWVDDVKSKLKFK